MLVLTRKPGERVLIGDDIVVTIIESRGDGVRIGIDAPRGVRIHREEVLKAVTEANRAASRPQERAEDAEARLRAALGLPEPAAAARAESPAQPES